MFSYLGHFLVELYHDYIIDLTHLEKLQQFSDDVTQEFSKKRIICDNII